MTITEITLRGLKSFPHNVQRVSLDPEGGKLCLLIGKNGSGKSTFITTFEFTTFGKARGREKKHATIPSLVNRYNKELATSIKFFSQGKEISIERGINPNKFNLEIDGVVPDVDPKKYDALIEQYVGMDMYSFRSFISLSVNDFKNFISLKQEEKDMLLDKLFNLESVSKMASIVRELKKVNKDDFDSNKREIRSLESTIETITATIERIREPKAPIVDNALEIQELVNKRDAYKEPFVVLKQKIEHLDTLLSAISEEFAKTKVLFDKVTIDLGSVDRELNLFNASKCPTCATNFDSEHFIGLKTTLEMRKVELLNTKNTLLESSTALKARKAKIDSIYTTLEATKTKINADVKQIGKKLAILRQQEQVAPELDLSEFENSILLNKEKVENFSSKNKTLIQRNACYEELSKLFGPAGIKATIISSIVEPLNDFIQENMNIINLPYRVIVDESFNVTISHMWEEIDDDTLSTGESRLVNIAILIAYLKLIRSKKSINVLFLDEIFSSVDTENVDILLKLLGDFAKEYHLNIFVVHHSVIAENFFDRIIRLEKNTFTDIIEVK